MTAQHLPRWLRGGSLLALFLLSACGSTTTASPTTAPSPSATHSPTATAAAPTATPTASLVTKTIPNCCTVSVPAEWIVSGPSGTGAYAVANNAPGNVIEVGFNPTGDQGQAQCTQGAQSSTSGSGFTPEETSSITIAGQVLPLYVSSGAGNEDLTVGVVLNGTCFRIDGIEDSTSKSPANRALLENILTTIRPNL